jgi:hypothetical protein
MLQRITTAIVITMPFVIVTLITLTILTTNQIIITKSVTS